MSRTAPRAGVPGSGRLGGARRQQGLPLSSRLKGDGEAMTHHRRTIEPQQHALGVQRPARGGVAQLQLVRSHRKLPLIGRVAHPLPVDEDQRGRLPLANADPQRGHKPGAHRVEERHRGPLEAPGVGPQLGIAPQPGGERLGGGLRLAEHGESAPR